MNATDVEKLQLQKASTRIATPFCECLTNHLVLFRVDAWSSTPTVALSRDGGCFGDEQASTGTLRIVLRIDLVGYARFARTAARQRRQHNAVAELQRAERETRKKLFGRHVSQKQ